jgi:hypothetical protein
MSARPASRTVNRPANEDLLREALRGLPADAPGPAFTARVLSRLAAAPARASRHRVPAWAAAAAVVLLVAVLWGGRALLRVQRTAALRSETEELARELEALRHAAERPAPVLYLGGNEEVDLVLDLSTLPLAAAVPAPLTESNEERR